MVGAPDILAGRSFAAGFASLANTATRPNFELRFNLLQNSIIGRINEEIEKINESSTENQVDAFLFLSQKKLTFFKETLQRFDYQNTRNAWTIPDLKDSLDRLRAAVDAGDTATFDSLIARVNEIVGYLHVVDGSAIGITIPDGIEAIRRDGLVTVDRSGVKTKITAFSQFVDANEARSAIDSAKSRLDVSLNAVLAKAEAAEAIRVSTERQLTATTLAIEAARTAAQAEKAAALAKVRENFSQLLNALSLAFESSQAMAEQLGKNLFNPNQVAPGSVANLFV